MRTLTAIAALFSVARGDGWAGCESFPGFGSAADNVKFTIGPDAGTFNITTLDFLRSRSCQGAPSLTWGHHGIYTCGGAGEVKFERRGVWIEAHTNGGLLFGRVLCPHISLKQGVRVEVPLEDLTTKCASVSFDNCATFYDRLSLTASGKELHRSSAPSCNSYPSRSANGPALQCTGQKCHAPCKHMAAEEFLLPSGGDMDLRQQALKLLREVSAASLIV